jgi:hypothetical protein
MKKLLLLVALIAFTSCCARYEAQKAVSLSNLAQLCKSCFLFEEDNERFPNTIGELLDYDKDMIVNLLICPASSIE